MDQRQTREVPMKKYVCSICGYVYDEEAGDPENGIEPGTKWEDLPDDWACPCLLYTSRRNAPKRNSCMPRSVNSRFAYGDNT